MSYSEAVQKELLPYKDTNLTYEIDDSSEEMFQMEQNLHSILLQLFYSLKKIRLQMLQCIWMSIAR